MKNVFTIAVGIPAYNEEKSIASLLRSILRQKHDNYILSEIIVISDGSTDNTEKMVQSIRDERIKLIAEKERLGKTIRVNQIFKMFKTDLLLLLDADILIKDVDFFQKLIDNLDIKKNGLVSAQPIPLPARNFFEKCINYSVSVQAKINEQWNHGDNYLSFRGMVLLLWGKFAKSTEVLTGTNNDAYLYFKAKEQGFKPKCLFAQPCYYRSPNNFTDYLNQSSRFQNSPKEMSQFFPNIEKEYRVPQFLLIKESFLSFLRHPILFLGYLCIFTLARLMRKKDFGHTWNIATTTKNLDNNI